MSRHAFDLKLVIFCLATCGGCAGYYLGSPTLYRPDIATIAIPIFESDSYRRFLGERLTEAVVKQVELKTPYKVTQTFSADSTLQGRIVTESKFVINENVNDEPRDIEFQMYVEMVWRDRQGAAIVGPAAIGIPASLLEFGQAVHFVPEGGQSLSTAQMDQIEKLAEQIVSRMEVPW